MTTKTFILLLCSTAIVSCHDINRTLNAPEDSIKIAVEVTPESDSSYTIIWKDTIGRSEGYSLHNRPYEIWCFLKDKNDTVGYYRGLSTPADFTYFSTKDTIIEATFVVGPNVFSEKYPESNKGRTETIIEYNPIELNLKKDLRKPLEFMLTKKNNKR